MKDIKLKNKKNVFTLTLVGDEHTVKKAALLGLAAFVKKVKTLDVETVRGPMGLAAMFVNDPILSEKDRKVAKAYYDAFNARYREVAKHT